MNNEIMWRMRRLLSSGMISRDEISKVNIVLSLIGELNVRHHDGGCWTYDWDTPCVKINSTMYDLYRLIPDAVIVNDVKIPEAYVLKERVAEGGKMIVLAHLDNLDVGSSTRHFPGFLWLVSDPMEYKTMYGKDANHGSHWLGADSDWSELRFEKPMKFGLSEDYHWVEKEEED